MAHRLTYVGLLCLVGQLLKLRSLLSVFLGIEYHALSFSFIKSWHMFDASILFRGTWLCAVLLNIAKQYFKYQSIFWYDTPNQYNMFVFILDLFLDWNGPILTQSRDIRWYFGKYRVVEILGFSLIMQKKSYVPGSS